MARRSNCSASRPNSLENAYFDRRRSGPAASPAKAVNQTLPRSPKLALSGDSANANSPAGRRIVPKIRRFSRERRKFI
jgi:hypothetical protein